MSNLHRETSRDLVDDWSRHHGPLTDARYGIGNVVSDEELAEHALAALAISEELAARFAGFRWSTVADGLARGLSLERIADVLRMTEQEAAYGFRSWVERQYQHGLMSRDHADEQLGLVTA